MKAKNTSLIGERELRDALKSHLYSSLDEYSILIEELGIENGSARIDMAVVSQQMCGYEIKSDFDTANRLYNQIHTYNRVFEHIYIVTGGLSGITIEELLPTWWGIIRGVRDKDGVIQLNILRTPTQNLNRDPYSLLTLLKRDELNSLALRSGLDVKIIKTNKNNIIETIATLLPLESINKEVTRYLKSRIKLTVALQ